MTPPDKERLCEFFNCVGAIYSDQRKAHTNVFQIRDHSTTMLYSKNLNYFQYLIVLLSALICSDYNIPFDIHWLTMHMPTSGTWLIAVQKNHCAIRHLVVWDSFLLQHIYSSISITFKHNNVKCKSLFISVNNWMCKVHACDIVIIVQNYF